MTGLLVRDGRYLRSQRLYLLILLALTVLYMASDLMAFGECFAPLLLSFTALRTVADDMRPERARALFALPLPRSLYVWEKLLTGMLLPWLLSVLLAAIATLAARQGIQESLVLCASMALAIGVLTAVFLPLCLRFGAHAVIYLPLVCLAVGVVAMAYDSLAGPGALGSLLDGATKWVDALSAWALFGAALGTSALLVAATGVIGIRILRHRDL
ncbi:MAG: ABC-2 transporter permease [Bifidobacterium sp.]|nr:ABC-2 transporter permease [Bifidobacterium sp.]